MDTMSRIFGSFKPTDERTVSEPSAVESQDEAAASDAMESNEAMNSNDIVGVILAALDSIDALRLSSVSTIFRSAAYSSLIWAHQISPQLLKAAESLSQPLSLPTLSLAFHRYNFLRNPQFTRDGNLTNTLSTLPWKRHAWIIKAIGGNGVAWESPVVGAPADVLQAKRYLCQKKKGTQQSTLVEHSVLERARQMLMQGLSLVNSPPEPAAAEAPSTSCIATSFQMSEICQVVDLVEELGNRGVSREQAEHLLDQGLTLGLSVMVGARFDQGAEFSVTFAIIGADPANPLTAASVHVPSDSSLHFHSGRFFVQDRNAWHRFAHACELPKGCRTAVVLLSGRDQNFWAGHYGAKFTSAELTFLNETKESYVGSDGVEAWRAKSRP